MIFTDYPGITLIHDNIAWPTPNIRSSTGSITALTVNRADLSRIGQIVLVYIDFTISNNGTGATAILVDLPLTPVHRSVYAGREVNVTGWQLMAETGITASIRITRHNNTYPGGGNHRCIISGSFEN